MFEKPSLFRRIAIGKSIGFLFGLAGLILLPFFLPEAGWQLRFGLLLWYTTLGAIIGVFGVLTRHPIMKLPLRWFFIRAPLMGAWMNFVLTFFAFDVMQEMTLTIFGKTDTVSTVFWFTLEGAIVGFIIGYFATKFGGEGKETVDR